MNLYQRIIAPYLLLIICISSPLQAATVDMQPGMWEWTTQMKMAGMDLQIPPTVFSSCITQQDLVPQNQSPNGDCKILENSTSGNTISWKIQCDSPHGSSTTSGKMTYSGSSASGAMDVVARGMAMSATMSGRRTGGCDK